MKNKITITIMIMLCLFITNACQSSSTSELDFLVGTWKAENQNQYETWEKVDSNTFKGTGYKLKDSSKFVTETLLIKISDSSIIYQATVSSQNEGKTISFILNPEVAEWFSFENELHDFPKKIKYKLIDEKKILVEVLGAEDKGFSFAFIKQ